MSISLGSFMRRGAFARRAPRAPTVVVVVLVSLMLVMTCAVAAAQGVSLSRAEPRAPLPPDGSPGLGPWVSVTIPGMPSNARLGEMWVSRDGHIYVWATWSTQPLPPAGPLSVHPDDPSPGDPVSLVQTYSALFVWDGHTWNRELYLDGQVGREVFGTCTGNVFAAAVGEGTVTVFHHYDPHAIRQSLAVRPDEPPEREPVKVGWHVDALPQLGTGRVGAMLGTEGDVLLRSGEHLLCQDGSSWNVMADDPMLAGGHEMVRIGPTELYLFTGAGHCLWNGELLTVFYGTLGDVMGSWGRRDSQLNLYATGHDGRFDGVRVWRFKETPGGGEYEVVLSDPPAPATRPGSYGSAMWGDAADNVYVAGAFGGRGCLYHFDGDAWARLAPSFPMSPGVDIHGTPWGDIYITTRNRLVIYRSGLASPAGPCGSGVGDAPAAPTSKVAPDPAEPTLSAARLEGSSLAVEFSVPVASDVRVGLFDVTGRSVANLASGLVGAGVHRLSWSTAGLRSGIYFCQMRAGRVARSRSVLILH